MPHGPTPPATSLLARILNPLEKVLLVAVVAGLILKILHLNGADETLMLSMLSLSTVFFLNAFHTVSESDQEKSRFETVLVGIIVPKIAWVGCSIVTTGLLFYLLHLYGAGQMLQVGSSVLTAVCVVCVYSLARSSIYTSYLVNILYRAAPLAALGWYMFMNLPSPESMIRNS